MLNTAAMYFPFQVAAFDHSQVQVLNTLLFIKINRLFTGSFLSNFQEHLFCPIPISYAGTKGFHNFVS
uniref:Uncharacterized protein n=1 Tax=Pararge aegeria TaxID=116150 RepID=S4PEH2_9NEOP